jgi:hypothetical protein
VTFQEGFLRGTHRSMGRNSHILKIRGNSAVLERIYSYFLGENTFRNRSIKNPDEILEQIRELIIYAEKKLPFVFKSLLAFSKELSPDQKNELIDKCYAHKFALKNCLLSWEMNPKAFAFLHSYLTESWWPQISKNKGLQSLLEMDPFDMSDGDEGDSSEDDEDDEDDDEDEDEDENRSVGKKLFNEAQERRYLEITKDAAIDTKMATFLPLRKSLQPFMDINLDKFFSVCDHCKKQTARLSCAKCKMVCYCSVKCQEKARKGHQSFCRNTEKHWKELKITEDDFTLFGRKTWFERSIVGSGLTFKIVQNWKKNMFNLLRDCGTCETITAMKHEFALLMKSLYHWYPIEDDVKSLTVYRLSGFYLYQEAYDFMKYWRYEHDLHLNVTFTEEFWYREDWQKEKKNYWKSDISEPVEVLFSSKFAPIDFIIMAVFIKFQYFYHYCFAKESFQSMLLGTHSRAGQASPVLSLYGEKKILKLIYSYCVWKHTFVKPKVRDYHAAGKQLFGLLALGEKQIPAIWKILLNSKVILKIPQSILSRSDGLKKLVQTAARNCFIGWQQTDIYSFLKSYLMSKGGMNYTVSKEDLGVCYDA